MEKESSSSPIYDIMRFYANTNVPQYKNGRSCQEKYECQKESGASVMVRIRV